MTIIPTCAAQPARFCRHQENTSQSNHCYPGVKVHCPKNRSKLEQEN
jgi:hypothetical protein